MLLLVLRGIACCIPVSVALYHFPKALSMSVVVMCSIISTFLTSSILSENSIQFALVRLGLGGITFTIAFVLNAITSGT